MRIRYDAADKWFSLCVRERDDWTCRVCKAKFTPPAQNLHASHFMSRRHRSLRWSPYNACAKCVSCHRKLGENPLEFAAWLEKEYGREYVENLREIAQTIVKTTKKDRAEIANHYKEQYQLMLEKRAKGVTGRLEFEAYS